MKNSLKKILPLFLFIICILLLNTTIGYAQSVTNSDEYIPVPKKPNEVLNNYRYRVDMNDNQTRYYILYDDEVYGYNSQGELTLLGFREPSKKQNTGYLFTFTILSNQKTYGVDQHGHAWYYSGNSREIVASVNRREALELFGKQ